jgi:hypothetical protein
MIVTVDAFVMRVGVREGCREHGKRAIGWDIIGTFGGSC